MSSLRLQAHNSIDLTGLPGFRCCNAEAGELSYGAGMQSRKASFAEACANVAIGYGVALASQLAVFPMFGIHVPLSSNIGIGVWFTGISLVRSYAVRRWFTRATEAA